MRAWKSLVVTTLLVGVICLPSRTATAHPHRGHGHGHGHGHGPGHWLLFDSDYRSPGLAVALSLTPMPVDFGNLYADNIGWGVAYTALELSLALPAVWLGGSHMGHGSRDNEWSSDERQLGLVLVTAYITVKLLAGLHAGYAAMAFNEAHAKPPDAPAATRSQGSTVTGASHALFSW